MRRNILRKTVSEDLDWAYCLKTNHDLLSFHIFHEQNLNKANEKRRTRSFESTNYQEFDELISGEDEETKNDNTP